MGRAQQKRRILGVVAQEALARGTDAVVREPEAESAQRLAETMDEELLGEASEPGVIRMEVVRHKAAEEVVVVESERSLAAVGFEPWSAAEKVGHAAEAEG